MAADDDIIIFDMRNLPIHSIGTKYRLRTLSVGIWLVGIRIPSPHYEYTPSAWQCFRSQLACDNSMRNRRSGVISKTIIRNN